MNITFVGRNYQCTLTENKLQIVGTYYRYDLHKRRRFTGTITVSIKDILRIGVIKTYSRTMFLFPMLFGCLALLIKSIPSAEIQYEIIPEVYSVGMTFWRVPFQDTAWMICAVLCLLTIPLYWLSYHTDLEVNTMQGRYLLSVRGIPKENIIQFQRQFLIYKAKK